MVQRDAEKVRRDHAFQIAPGAEVNGAALMLNEPDRNLRP